jgi:hypothetical protein
VPVVDLLPACGLAWLQCPGVPAEEGPPPRDVLAALVASLRGELADALAALEDTR